ncbi:MAG: serine/threonine-protein phosphatase [Chloroflexi bacterium]|nr:serine/threonine-protein phosphatase [Chloroflexota bacterium]
MKPILPEFDSSGLSHIGPVREDNQDAIQLPNGHLTAERGWLFGVADGMGGYAHGDMASTLALEKLFEAFYGERALPVERALRRGIESANLGVYKQAQRLGAGRMGTTLTAAGVVGNQLYLAHVGDSRAYLIRDGRATCLTEDHTTVGELVRMKVLSADKVRTHAQRSILTKGIGLTLFVQPDITQHTLREGDRVVLCSDGVWSVIQDDEFAELTAQTNRAQELSLRLINLALERQTDDNCSAITIHIQRLSPSPAGNSSSRKGLSLREWISRHVAMFFHSRLTLEV